MARKFNKINAIRVYQAMIEFQHETDFSITTRELADRLGYASNSCVHPYLKWLVANGYVKTRGKQMRAIPNQINGGVL